MLLKKLNLLTLKSLLSFFIATLCLTLASTSHAAQEIGDNLRSTNTSIVNDAFEWQFMLDLSVANTPVILADVEQTEPWDYFQMGILFDISYKGFFLRTNSRRSLNSIGSGELGYQITAHKNWKLDVILKAYIAGFDPVEIIKDKDKDIPQLSGLNERKPTGGLALRYSYFFDNAIFYIDVATASVGEKEQNNRASGLIIDSFYSYLLPYRNWDIYLGAGLTYYDKDLMDYYIGINADEVTSSRQLYSANHTIRAQLEVYAQHPLSQSWSFNVGLTQSFYSTSIKSSPLVDKSNLTQLMVGVLYVF